MCVAGSENAITGHYSLGGANGQSCTSAVNQSANHQPYDTSFAGGTPDFVLNGCGNTIDKSILPASAGTNAITVLGSGTVTSAGNNVDPTPITVNGGHINLSALNTTIACNTPGAFCPVGLNEAEFDFGDMSKNVFGGDHTMTGGKLFLDQSISTGTGSFVPRSPPNVPDDHFLFEVPPDILFDSLGIGDGQPAGAGVRSDQAFTGTIDLQTGAIVLDFALTEIIAGSPAQLTGAALTDQVTEIAPVVTAAATVSANATTSSCTANVKLSASASSPLGLPVNVSFAVSPPGISASGTNATFTLPVGTHNVTILAVDSNGGETTTTETVTVNDEAPPVFGAVPTSDVAQSCSSSGSVPVTVPTATDPCTGAAVPVTGTVVQFNGVTVSIPVINGTVTVPPGSGTLQFVAAGLGGATTTVEVPLTVIASPTFFGKQGVAVDSAAHVAGTIDSAAGGQVIVQNDAHVGAVVSLSPVLLQDRVVATSIDSSAGITLGHSDTIGSSSSALPVLPAFPSLPVTFTGGQAITLNSPNAPPPAVTARTLAPGQYGAVIVDPRAQLALSAGDYEFTSLDLEPQGELVLPSATGETVRIFVENAVTFHGSANVASTSSTPPPAPLFLEYFGGATLQIGSPFTGTILAPNAELELQSLNNTGSYTGEFFAKQVTVDPNTTVNSDPVTCIP